ncbi:hypothetical protein TNCV_3574641 [Trichonephila clavipes]|nr:hypothetical protein TNCV_3574641 [Trichonephila clavipes]
MTPVEDPAIVFASAQLILLYLGTAAVAFPASRHALLAKDLVTWQAMVGRHILEDIVGRVAQYVDEHYPVDKWHLGRLDSMGSTIGVKISSTYLRAVKVP